MKITKGQIVAITNGEYSDYCLRDHLRALKDFDSGEEIKRFKETGPYLEPPSWNPKGEPEEYESDERFLAWTIREGLMEPLDDGAVTELWIGAYGLISG